MINNQGKLESNKDLIYFGNLKSENNAVIHTGDNVTGRWRRRRRRTNIS